MALPTNPLSGITGTSSTSPALVGQWYQNYTAQNPTSTPAPTQQPVQTQTQQPLIGSPSAQQGSTAAPISMSMTEYQQSQQPAAAPAGPVQTYDAQTYGTTDWNVDDNQLVSSGVDKLIAKDGPLMERARAAADAESNKRGLVNSSMGIGASQNAVYDHATAIAGADAKTYSDAARTNAQERNLAAFNNAQMTNRAREFGAAAANAYGIAELGSMTQIQVAGIGAAASRYGTDVGAATELERAQIAADSQKYGVDVSSKTELQKAAIAADSQKYGIDVGSATSILQSQIAAGASKTVAEINRDSAWATANLSAETQKAVTGMTTESQRLVATINADTNKYIATMDDQTKLQVQQFANENQLLLNTNTQATSAFNQAMAAISTIQNNASMDANTKTQAIRSIFASVNSQFNTLEGISGLNIPDLLDFTGNETIAAGTDTGTTKAATDVSPSDAGNAGPGNGS